MKEKKGIKYILYNKIKKFEDLSNEQFIEKLKNKSYKMFICEKIFDDKEIYHEEQMEEDENIKIMKAIKRKYHLVMKKRKKKEKKKKIKI